MLRTWVSSIVAFLRVGCPSGAPATGYEPLLTLLPRKVSDDEAVVVMGKLIGRGRRSIDRADVGVEIIRITGEMPSLDDIERVHIDLANVGVSGYAVRRPICLSSGLNIVRCQALWPASSTAERSSPGKTQTCRPCDRPTTYRGRRPHWKSARLSPWNRLLAQILV